MFRVWNVPGFVKKRYGPDDDGGYVIIDSPLGAKHMLGYGVGRDVVFENQVTASWGIHAHVFDHTITKIPEMGPNVTYIPEGISAKDEAPLYSLATHVSKYVPNDAEYILKIDVEGAEWDVLDTADLSRVTQLIIEIHDLETDNSRIIEKINKNFYLVNLHGTNCHNQPYVYIDRVHRIPRYLECVYVRKDLAPGAAPNTDALPGPLERKCRPDVPELDIDFMIPNDKPVSFIVNDPINSKLIQMLLTDDDEVISDINKAKNDRIFVIQPGDLFPYNIIMSLSQFPGNIQFKVVYNGFVNFENRFFIKNCPNLHTSDAPIFNLRSLKGYK